MMTPLKDWKRILRKAWSVRVMALATLLTACEVALPLYVDDMPRGLFAAISAVAIVGAMIARVLAQKEFEQ